MSFLDTKEQVIELQLTQYGKHLLSLGKFNPKMYAFFDDDILYDSSYADIEENHMETQNRIEEETPRIKAQYVFSSREDEIRKLNEELNSVGPRSGRYTQPSVEKRYALSAPLGNSSLAVNKLPAWKINLLRGKIESSNKFITGDVQTIKIPQLFLEPVVYKTEIGMDLPPEDRTSSPPEMTGEPYTLSEQGDLETVAIQFRDGSYIKVIEDNIIIDVKELNSEFQNENFDIEVFLVERTDAQGNIISGTEQQDSLNERLFPLSFKATKREIINGFLIDNELNQQNNEYFDNDPSYVEYWFDIKFDDEISDSVTSSLENNIEENLYLASK